MDTQFETFLGVVRIISQFFTQIQTLPCFTHTWMELITIIREGLLCFRSLDSSSDAEVANEIFTSHTKAACCLMTLVSNTTSNGNVQNSQLEISVDYVCDFGQPEDLVFDTDEMMSKQFISYFGKIFVNASDGLDKQKEQKDSPQRSETMIIKFVKLVERVMNNRPKRSSHSSSRYTSVISGAEREYFSALEGIAIPSSKPRSVNIQMEIIHLSHSTYFPETAIYGFYKGVAKPFKKSTLPVRPLLAQARLLCLHRTRRAVLQWCSRHF